MRNHRQLIKYAINSGRGSALRYELNLLKGERAVQYVLESMQQLGKTSANDIEEVRLMIVCS